MKHLRLILGVVAFNLFAGAGIAQADPVTAAVTSILTTIGASASLAATIASFTVALLKNAGMSLLGQALSKKPKVQTAGIKTQTSTGGSIAQTFVLGRRATAGQLVTPLMTYGIAGKTENAYLVYVIALGCIPGQTISEVMLNDEYVSVAATETAIGGSTVMGYALGGQKYEGHAWLRYHDGSQTAVDALLAQKLSGYPERPWTPAMTGKGIPYAILVFKYNREVLNAPPSVRFVMNGIPLYDPRKDASNTEILGEGLQSWGSKAHWETTLNPAVMMYNLHRGITLPDGSVYGGEAAADDLPLANWAAAMNACDEPVALAAGGTEPRYTAGLEVSLSDEPADVFEALETACQAQQVEIGGVWKIRVGGPGMPVAFVTDDDILVDHDRNHDMFPGLNETYNGIQASHPLPSALWEMSDAPVRYNAALEAEDDGRRLIADLSLTAVFSPTQAQRLMKGFIDEERRFRRHYLTMGPYASMLEPLDAIRWTSASERYSGKLFEVTRVNEGLRTLNVDLGLRERNGDDFVWNTSHQKPWVAGKPGTGFPAPQAVPGFTVLPESAKDGANVARRPAILMIWDGDDMPDVSGLRYEVRVAATTEPVTKGTISDILASPVLIVEGIVSNTAYQVRARLIVERPTEWTPWKDVTTGDIRIGIDDLAEPLIAAIETPLDELLKTNLQLQTYQQVQDALNYTGDGRSLQFATLEAVNKGEDAIDRFNLLGTLSSDRKAYVLNTAFARISETQSLAGFLTSVSTMNTTVTQSADAIDLLKARYTLSVANVGASGQKAVAGMVAEAGTTSTIGFFAQNFFIADNSGPGYKYPFAYTNHKVVLTGDVEVHGNLLVTESITTPKLITNAVTDFFTETYGPFADVGGLHDGLGTEVAFGTFNPNKGRVRITYRIAVGSATRCAARVKIIRNDTDNISGSVLFIVEEAFTTTITSYIYDTIVTDAQTDYSVYVQTVNGQNIGDTGGSAVSAAVFSCNITLESIKR